MRLAYTIIMSKFCDTAIKHKIECKANFSGEIEDDPIQLLAAIKDIMHSVSSQRLVSPYEALWSTMAQLFKLKREIKESLEDYYNKMKAFSEQAKKYFDDDLLNKFVEGTDQWKNTDSNLEQDALKKGAWKRFIAMGFQSILTKTNMENC